MRRLDLHVHVMCENRLINGRMQEGVVWLEDGYIESVGELNIGKVEVNSGMTYNIFIFTLKQ